MGNEHVTDKQLKNSVFTAFGVLKTISSCISAIYGKPTDIKFVGFFELITVVYLQ